MCHFSHILRGFLIYLSISVFSLSTASSLPPTAAPLFHNTPFAVIWNAPSPVCENLNITLDFSAFQAVTTPSSKPDQLLFLFYSKRLGLYPYINPTTKKEYNGGIPQKGNLTANLEKAHIDITQFISESSPGLAVIDYESWRPMWARNWDSKEVYQKVSINFTQDKNPALSYYKAITLALEQFQKAARSYMEETMKLGIRRRPKYLWGYYLFPDCYNYNWADPGYTGECPEIEKKCNDELLWLWESSTALFPSAYLPLSLRENPKATLFVRNMVKEALRVSALPNQNHTPPVYVYLQPVFSEQNKIYLNQADLISTIGESAALGAAGAVLWGSSTDYDTKASCEALAAHLQSTLNSYVANVTAAAKLCSDILCKGKGRCVRKNPNSDDYLHLSSNHFHIQKQNGKYVATGMPSLSELNFFAEKFTCQCYVEEECSANMSMSPPQSSVSIEV